MVPCGGGETGNNTPLSPATLSDEEITIFADNQIATVTFIDGSDTWKNEYVSSCLEDCISDTNDPLGPWYGQSVNFKGIESGGKDLIYRYKLEFNQDVEISSIEISGIGWGKFRLLDERMNDLINIDLPAGNELQTHTIHTHGSASNIYYMEEIDSVNTVSRYRSNIKAHFSQACASQANIIFDGSNYSGISGIYDGSTPGWFVEEDSIYTYWDYDPIGGTDNWVEYEAYLTKGKWVIGLCAINIGDRGLGPDPEWYPYFDLSAILKDKEDTVAAGSIAVPASDTNLNSGYYNFEIPEDGWYTVRLTWLNDQVKGTMPDGSPEFDTNIKIARVFFDGDDDDDGVPNFNDVCSETAFGANVDIDGCSGEQIVDRECPCDDRWKNHGKYVSCVAHSAEEQLEASLITSLEKDAIVSTRAKSDCGKKNDDDNDEDEDEDEEDDDDDDNNDLPIYQLPKVITENNTIHLLPAGIFNRGLTVKGNNFSLTGNNVENCGSRGQTVIKGDVVINGNNATFRNITFNGNVIENGNGTQFIDCCF
jgi:hypothetical protein